MSAPDESAVRTIEFEANPTQLEFIRSHKQADLFSSRMGEGKSTALVWSCFHHTQKNPGARWLFIRDTWENLRDTTQVEFFKWFEPGVMGTYVESRKEWTWACNEMRSKVRWMGLDDERDAAKLQSRELGGAALDEPSPAGHKGGIPEVIFDTVLTRMRQPGMSWYPCKLAQNNSDENHWTYKRFVKPGDPEFGNFQTTRPENIANLPPDYHARTAHALRHRPDLYQRYVTGGYGYRTDGKGVTTNYQASLHLTSGLLPIGNLPLYMFWDWGHNPTCIVAQVTPMGVLHILESFVGEDEGVHQLIENLVKPAVAQRYQRAVKITHIGDPNGETGSDVDIEQNCVKKVRKLIPGGWRAGPVSIPGRVNPLQALLSRQQDGIGLIRIDEDHATEVHKALRGGWHYKVVNGITGKDPVKDEHSHPGDALGYGVAVLYPQGVVKAPKRDGARRKVGQARYGRGRQLIGGGRKIAPAPGLGNR